MRKLARSDVIKVVEVLLEHGARRAVRYVSPEFTVTAALPHKRRKNARSTTIVLTFGKPNYAAREFIKRCQKAGEPFPVKKVQLQLRAGAHG